MTGQTGAKICKVKVTSLKVDAKKKNHIPSKKQTLFSQHVILIFLFQYFFTKAVYRLGSIYTRFQTNLNFCINAINTPLSQNL